MVQAVHVRFDASRESGRVELRPQHSALVDVYITKGPLVELSQV
jgi:hypothetical protein